MKKHLWIGGAVSLGLFLLSIILFGTFSVMGVSNQKIQSYIWENYLWYLLGFNGLILLAYLAAGGLFALASGLLRLGHKKMILAFHLFLWGSAWIRAIKLYPQLFCDQLLNRGGPARWFQVLVTDFLPLWLILLAPLALILLLAWRKKRILAGIFISAAILLVFFPFTHRAASVKPGAKKPNILLLAADSLRPDHLSYNGYSRKTSPQIDELFARGGNFVNLQSSSAKTFSSWVSLLTSLYPPQHGIRSMFPSFQDRRKSWRTLTGELNRQGYYSAVVTDFAGDIFSRVDLGFNRVQSPYFSLKVLIQQRSLEIHHWLLSILLSPHGKRIFPVMNEMAYFTEPYYLTEKTKGNIRHAAAAGQPFFIVTFYSTCHFPYCPQYPYYQLFTDRSYRGPNKYKKENLLAEYSSQAIAPADKRQIIDLYDGGIRLFDDQVGEIRDYLKRSGLDQDTILVIMSDHGENLYDEDYGMGHGDHLRGNPANRLVFGVYDPRNPFHGVKIPDLARDIDVAPTLLQLAGISPPKEFRGRTLVPFLRGRSRPAFPHYQETDIWFTPGIPRLEKGTRLQYPDLTELLEVDPRSDELVLKDAYRFDVINAKHRAIVTEEFKYIYMPGEFNVIQEVFRNDLPHVPANRILNRKLLSSLKAELQDMFPGLFIELPGGRLLEKNSFPDNFLTFRLGRALPPSPPQ